MFEHVLIPLDGSRMAEAALPAAAFLAGKLGARITLMHVVERRAPREVHGQAHLVDAAEARAYLERISAQLQQSGLRADCHVHEDEVSDVARSIVAHLDELDYDLVIMCSHGRGRAVHLFLGSIAQKVIGLGTRPVLITHPDERGEPFPFSCRRILVPLDGDPGHRHSLPVSRDLARACQASLLLAMVIPHLTSLSAEDAATSRTLPGTTYRMLEMAHQEANEYLEAEAAGLNRAGVETHAYVLRGDPARLIVEAARQAQVDLIALATHGKSGMKAFWAGSVAHKICGATRLPLLLIPIPRKTADDHSGDDTPARF